MAFFCGTCLRFMILTAGEPKPSQVPLDSISEHLHIVNNLVKQINAL